MTNAITIRLLDREVVLKRDRSGWIGSLDGADLVAHPTIYGEIWCHLLAPGGSQIGGAGRDIRGAVKHLDQRLRELMAWMAEVKS